MVIFLYCFLSHQNNKVLKYFGTKLHDYQNYYNIKKWIFTKGIGLFSLNYIRNTVCHINLEAKQLSY